jgi:APA family basic amino acid/polyamine antiporter
MSTTQGDASVPPGLERAVGVPGAVLMGLGSILGTGIFVSIGIAAGVTGPSVILAVVVAAVVATFNGLSSAQLAASHPVSGGTYEYGHRYLNPTLAFTAGWMFLCAKSASAATAALGFAGYVLVAAGQSAFTYRVALALVAVVVLTLVVAGGIRRSNRANTIIVTLTLIALAAFVAFGLPSAVAGASGHLDAIFDGEGGGASGFLHATALMFVAYTGYGRIATLGEEVRDPRKEHSSRDHRDARGDRGHLRARRVRSRGVGGCSRSG